MVRLKNTKSGAVVSVTDEKAGRLGAEWAPVVAEKPAAEPVKRAPGRPRKSEESE